MVLTINAAPVNCADRRDFTRPILLSLTPGLVRVEPSHLLGKSGRIGAEILLVNNAMVIHDEGMDSRHTILGRPGDQSEAANHFGFDQITKRASLGVRPL